jgi:gluconolactonase
MSSEALSEASVLFDGTFTSPRLDHPESVAVAADGSLWCGGEQGQIYRITSGSIELIASTGGFTLGVAFLDNSTLAVCDIARPAVWLLDLRTRELTPLEPSIPGHQLLTPNAVVGLPDGSMLVTDSGIAHSPYPGILRYYRDGTAEVWLDRPLDFANGIAVSAAVDTVYVAESWAYRVLAIGLQPGQWTPRGFSVYADLATAIPDGLAIDTDGVLYVGCYEPSQVLRVPGGGQVELLAHDPTAHTLCHPTGVAARGPEIVVANLGRWHLSRIPLHQDRRTS